MFFIFVLSNETETGTAGEQPVRDTFDKRRKCQVQEGFLCESPLDIFRAFYALKNSSINFFLQLIYSKRNGLRISQSEI